MVEPKSRLVWSNTLEMLAFYRNLVEYQGITFTFNLDQNIYFQVDACFANRMNQRSCTRPNPLEPKSCLVRANTFGNPAFYRNLGEYRCTGVSPTVFPRQPKNLFRSWYPLYQYNEVKVFHQPKPVWTKIRSSSGHRKQQSSIIDPSNPILAN